MSKYVKVNFMEIKIKVPTKPGLYEIYTIDNIPLKVGISNNLQKRLLNHYASRQNALKLKLNGDWSKPADVTSKSSILAKHLYFSDLSKDYNLKTEEGRHRFLEESCFIKFFVTESKEEARALEKIIEASGKFPFVGKTLISSSFLPKLTF